jgi:hypothetical protein
LWKLTEKLSGEDQITKRAVDLFYTQIDGLINKRLDAMAKGYKPKADAGVDLLDLFMQSTTDTYTLGGMIFSFLSAGRECLAPKLWSSGDSAKQETPPLSALRGS